MKTELVAEHGNGSHVKHVETVGRGDFAIELVRYTHSPFGYQCELRSQSGTGSVTFDVCDIPDLVKACQVACREAFNDGWLDDSARDDLACFEHALSRVFGRLSAEFMLGRCPKCSSSPGFVVVGGDCWAVCDMHKYRWYVGGCSRSPLGDRDHQLAAWNEISHYTQIESKGRMSIK